MQGGWASTVAGRICPSGDEKQRPEEGRLQDRGFGGASGSLQEEAAGLQLQLDLDIASAAAGMGSQPRRRSVLKPHGAG